MAFLAQCRASAEQAVKPTPGEDPLAELFPLPTEVAAADLKANASLHLLWKQQLLPRLFEPPPWLFPAPDLGGRPW